MNYYFASDQRPPTFDVGSLRAHVSQRDQTQSIVNSMFDERAFPRTAKYDERWIRENALGENALCQAESLARHLPFSSGMRVLELGVRQSDELDLLAREFDVQVSPAYRVVDAVGAAFINSTSTLGKLE